jgi:cytochrome c
MKIKSGLCSSLVAAAVGAFTAVGSGAAVGAQDLNVQWSGSFTMAQAGRGGELYHDMCSACHGDELLGSEMAPGLVDDVFSAKWHDRTLADLFDVIRRTMPQNDPGSLSDQQAADLLAFVLHRTNYSAGTQELPADVAILKTFKFLVNKPVTEK